MLSSTPSRRNGRFGLPRAIGRAGGNAAEFDAVVSASQSSVDALPTGITNDGADDSTITVVVRNASGAGIPGVTVVPASTGSSNTFAPTSGTTDGNGEVTFAFTSTSEATKTISATAGGTAITDTATVTVSASGGGGTFVPVFLSDWGNATGTGSSALRDGTVWDTLSPGSADNGQVVAAPVGKGWNTTNVLQHYSVNAVRAGWLEVSRNTLGQQVDGEVRNFRWAVQNIHPTAAEGATDHSHHGVQDGYPVGAGSYQNWNLTDGTNYAGEWEPNFLIANGGGGRYYLDSTVSPTRLSKDTKYTFEVQLVRSGTTFRFRAWVYDADGVELYGPADWKSSNYPGETLATERYHTFNNLPGTQQLNIGCNGTVASSYPVSLGYYSEVAVVSSTDNVSLTAGTAIGPFGSCAGE